MTADPQDTPPAGGAPHLPRIVVGILVALTTLRLWLCTTFELVGDEAYYWRWSKHLDWCYYSKGPLVSWTIRLGTFLFGDTVLGIRFFTVCLGTGTLALLYLLSQRLFSQRTAFWTLVMAACTPLFVIGSLLMTIDPLSIFFWLAAANVFWRAKHTDRSAPWIGAGALVGIGMLAKYTNVALLPSFALFLAWSKPYRSHLRRPNFWLMCLTAAVFLVPVLWWNAQHDWITLVHLQERGALDRAWRFAPSEFLDYLGVQVLVYFPFFFVGILFSLIHGGVRQRAPVGYRFLASLVLPLLGIYSILALNDSGEANWTAPAVICGMPLLAATWCQLADLHRWARIVATAALLLAGIGTVAVLSATAIRLPGEQDPLRRIRGWRDLAAQVDQFQTEKNASFVIGRDYQCASLMSFYLEGHPRTYIPNRPVIQNQYSFWPTYGPAMEGQNAVFVSRHAYPADVLHSQFQSIEPPLETWSHFRGHPVRPYYLHLCRGYVGGDSGL